MLLTVVKSSVFFALLAAVAGCAGMGTTPADITEVPEKRVIKVKANSPTTSSRHSRSPCLVVQALHLQTFKMTRESCLTTKTP